MTTKTLYLHVGWSKTGTSAIQKAIHLHRHVFLQNGILYPQSIQWNDHSHHNFSLAFNDTSGYSSHLSKNDAIKVFVEEFKESGCHSAIISSELSPFYFSDADFKSMVNSEFDNVKVIFSLRRQSELLLSLYNQLIKDPQVRFSSSIFTLAMNNLPWLNFYQKINQWAEVVQDENIKIFLHDKDIVDKVFQYFNVKLDSEIIATNEKTNVSIPNGALKAIQQINNGIDDIPTYVSNRNRVIDMYSQLHKINYNFDLFSAAEQRSLDSHFMNTNNLLAQKYLDQSELFANKQYLPVKAVGVKILENQFNALGKV